jgi:hypothetical protein
MCVAKPRPAPKALNAAVVDCQLLLSSTAMEPAPCAARQAQIRAWALVADPWCGAVITATFDQGTRMPAHPAPAESLQMITPWSSVLVSPPQPGHQRPPILDAQEQRRDEAFRRVCHRDRADVHLLALIRVAVPGRPSVRHGSSSSVSTLNHRITATGAASRMMRSSLSAVVASRFATTGGVPLNRFPPRRCQESFRNCSSASAIPIRMSPWGGQNVLLDG